MSRVDERTQVLPEASLNAGSKRRACEVGEKTLHCFLVADQVVVDEIYVAPVAKLVEPVELLIEQLPANVSRPRGLFWRKRGALLRQQRLRLCTRLR